MPGLITNRLQGFGRRKPGVGYRVDPSHPLAGFCGCWLLNECGGFGGGDAYVLNDYSGKANRLQMPETQPVWQSGPFANSSLYFNAIVRYLRAQSDRGFPYGSSGRTFLAWIKPVNTDQGIWLHYGAGFTYGAPAFIVGCQFSAPDYYLFTDGVNANNLTISGSEIPPNDVWSQVAFTVQDGGSTWAYYMNGAFVKGGTFAVALNTSPRSVDAYRLFIGERADYAPAPGYFNGSMDHVLLYPRALSARQIKQLYDEPFAFMSRPAPRRTFFGPQQVVSFPTAKLTTWPPMALGRFGAGAAAPAVAGKFQPAWARRGVIIGGGVY